MADETDDDTLRKILRRTRTIAVVGQSPNPVRPSAYVARYLQLRGYRIIPVNERAAGQVLLGQTVRASLDDLGPEDAVDMVDIFRRSEAVGPIVDTALARLGPTLKTIWMQIGVINEEAAQRARQAGLDVVQDRCPKIEYQRLCGELRMGGFATGRVSSRLPGGL